METAPTAPLRSLQGPDPQNTANAAQAFGTSSMGTAALPNAPSSAALALATQLEPQEPSNSAQTLARQSSAQEAVLGAAAAQSLAGLSGPGVQDLTNIPWSSRQPSLRKDQVSSSVPSR
ncbi:unnamed protein product, partial [Polarella glacialis]